MNASDLITKAENLIEEQYPNTVWRAWIEDVLRDLTPAAKLLTETEVAVTLTSGDVTIAVSGITNLYEIVSVSFKPTGGRVMQLRKLSPFDSVGRGWVRHDSEIRLQGLPYSSGTAIVKYYESLVLTQAGTEYTYNMPEGYDEVLLRGVCAFAMQKEEEFDRKQDFFGEYMLGKRRMLMERTLAMEPWNAQAIMSMGGEG